MSTQRELSDAAEKADCEKALLALAGWYPTPVEGYGFNTSWAISDLCRAIQQLRAAAPSLHKEEPDFGTAEEVIAGLDAINKHNAALHKEEVNMTRDPRDKQESGEHRADSEETSAFDAKAWLAKEYPDWIADVKEYELELIERAYNSGRAALHKEGARCNYYFGGFDGGNRCQLGKGHSPGTGHIWRVEDEAASPAGRAEQGVKGFAGDPRDSK